MVVAIGMHCMPLRRRRIVVDQGALNLIAENYDLSCSEVTQRQKGQIVISLVYEVIYCVEIFWTILSAKEGTVQGQTIKV